MKKRHFWREKRRQNPAQPVGKGDKIPHSLSEKATKSRTACRKRLLEPAKYKGLPSFEKVS